MSQSAPPHPVVFMFFLPLLPHCSRALELDRVMAVPSLLSQTSHATSVSDFGFFSWYWFVGAGSDPGPWCFTHTRNDSLHEDPKHTVMLTVYPKSHRQKSQSMKTGITKGNPKQHNNKLHNKTHSLKCSTQFSSMKLMTEDLWTCSCIWFKSMGLGEIVFRP